jgi:hypothetical protein
VEKPCRRNFGEIIQKKIREPIEISFLFTRQIGQIPSESTRDLQKIFRLFDHIITEEDQVDGANLEQNNGPVWCNKLYKSLTKSKTRFMMSAMMHFTMNISSRLEIVMKR